MISKEDTQILKGLAILMVIVEHLGQVLHITALNPLGPIGVCLFLFVSGYGLSCSYKKNGRNKYFSKRILKVYIPYLVSIAIFSIWSYFIGKTLTVKAIFSYAILKELPQGSFWYLQLLFYWYMVFYFLTFLFDNEKVLATALCVATFVITVYSGFNRLYVWQFASFPAGIIISKNKQMTFKIPKNIRGALLLTVSVIMVILKKTQYVEAHELGVADTILQIGITWCLSLLMFCVTEHLKRKKALEKLILAIGSVSYELYLAHVLPLDWLKQQVTTKNLLFYGIIVLLFTTILYVADFFIQRIEKNMMRN